MLSTMLPLRKLYELIHEYPHHCKSFKKEARARTAEKIDPLTIPLRRTLKEAATLPWRTFYPDDSGEWWKEYCIITDAEFTDEELREIIEEEWIHIYSPYDCTGKVFTSSLTATRMPCGILFVHCKGVDV